MLRKKSLRLPLLSVLVIVSSALGIAQDVQDDFEGNGNITTWFGDNCAINTNLNNPHQNGINVSNKVLE